MPVRSILRSDKAATSRKLLIFISLPGRMLLIRCAASVRISRPLTPVRSIVLPSLIGMFADGNQQTRFCAASIIQNLNSLYRCFF